jgi:hypothetical protein
MKKALFTFLIFFYCSEFYSQIYIQSYALDIGHWNNYYREWDWEPTKKCNILFTLQGDIILSNDKANSTYYTYENIDKDSWKVLDEKRRECIISMIYNEPNYNFLIVIYNDLCYRYIYSAK